MRKNAARLPAAMVITMVAMPMVVAVPAVVTVPATAPVHVGCRLLRILLDGGRSAGAGQRERLCVLGRCGYYEQCANSRKPQNFPHLHTSSPWSFDVTSQRTVRFESNPRCRNADRKEIANDVNWE
jgi:hypothetical protein